MKKIALLTIVLLCCVHGAMAQYGVLGKAEWQTCKDPVTGLTLTMLTDTTKNDRFLYQTDPMWTPDGRYLLFRSSSRGEEVEYTDKDGNKRKRRPTQLFFIEVATGNIIQATDGENTGAGFLANRSNRLFLNRKIDGKWNLYVIDLDRFFADVHAGKAKKPERYEKFIGTFPEEMGRPGGYCVNSEDDWAYITVERDGTQEEIDRMNANAFLPESNQPVKIKPTLSGIRKMNLLTGKVTKVCDVEFKVGHIQASRFHGDEIVFCNETGGDAYQRMWFVKSDGSNLRPLYKETPLDWVTHETFATEDYVYFNVLGFQPRLRKQAHGIFRINLRNDDVDVVGQVETSTPAKIDNQMLGGKGFWHCNASRDGKWAAGDTFAGSVWVINTETGERRQIASDCRMKPDHAQPFFSPDGRMLCFQSGRFSDGKRLTLMMVDLSQITNPTAMLDVRKFGAAGDGRHIDSDAVDRAIDAASCLGGGTVFFPAGRYKCYSIHLKSNVTLLLDKDATILAAMPEGERGYDAPEHNPDSLYQDFGHSHWHNSLIWGENLRNVALCGEGMIDGSGVLSRGTSRNRRGGVTVANKALALKNCTNVKISGTRFLNCGHFAMLLTGVDSLLIEDVVADTNRDGIDIDCCENVVVRGCKVNTLNDDAIVLKCSYALGWAKPTQNVVIENCEVSGYDTGTFMDGTKQTTVEVVPDRDGPTGRIKLGTESSTSFRNILVRNCRFNHCRGLAIETVDGAALENVEFSDITMNDICNSPIYIRLGNRMRSPEGTAPSSINGVRINNVTVTDADCRYACLIYGMKGNPIRNVSISNLSVEYRGGLTMADFKEQRGRNTFFSSRNENTYPEPSAHGIQPAWGWSLQHIDGIELKNVSMTLKNPDERPRMYKTDVRKLKEKNR